eukprot:UN08495
MDVKSEIESDLLSESEKRDVKGIAKVLMVSVDEALRLWQRANKNVTLVFEQVIFFNRVFCKAWDVFVFFSDFF